MSAKVSHSPLVDSLYYLSIFFYIEFDVNTAFGTPQ